MTILFTHTFHDYIGEKVLAKFEHREPWRVPSQPCQQAGVPFIIKK